MSAVIVVVAALVGAQHAVPLQEPIVIRAANVVDGRGAVRHDVDIVIRDGRIAWPTGLFGCFAGIFVGVPLIIASLVSPNIAAALVAAVLGTPILYALFDR